MSEVIRICLDLNIWCSALIANLKQKKNTASQMLVRCVQQGACDIGSVQFIVSWGMLERLRLVLENEIGISPNAANLYIESIKNYAELGAKQLSPQLTLGGTGIIALRDEEDGHVMDTAIAGRVLILVTNNFKDFINKDTKVIVEKKHAIHLTANHSFHIVHSSACAEWIRNKTIPSIETTLKSYKSLDIDFDLNY